MMPRATFKTIFCFLTLAACHPDKKPGNKFTYYDHIQPIIEQNCFPCHDEGGAGPIKITTYEQTSQYASIIAHVVREGQMPPWYAGEPSWPFKNKRALSIENRATLLAWLQSDRIKGKPQKSAETPTRHYTKPDIIFRAPTPIQLKAGSLETFADVVIPVNMNEPIEVQAIEVRPSQSRYAHHAIYSINSTAATAAREAISEMEVYLDSTSIMSGGWAPGWSELRFPDSFGFTLPAKAAINLQMHYGHIDKDTTDYVEVLIWKATKPVTRHCTFMGFDATASEDVQLSEPLIIPANTTKTFTIKKTLQENLTILTISPHMHLLGKSYKATAQLPSGKIIPLITVPEWNFRWQDTYMCSPLLTLPKGTTITVTANYDNTIQNINNPHSPPIDVVGGWNYDKEMMSFIIIAASGKRGDELIKW